MLFYIFFLNAQHIQDYLALYYNGSTSDVLLYLTDGSGTPISLSSADDNYAIATDTAIQRGIRYLSGTGNKLLHTGDRYILLVPIANSDLYLANTCRNMRFIPGSAALTLCSYRSLWSCFY